MKSLKLALIATTVLSSSIVFTEEVKNKEAVHAHTASVDHKNKVHHAAHIVVIKTEEIITKSKFGVDVQAKMAKEQQELEKPLVVMDNNFKTQQAMLMQEDKDLRKEAEELEGKATLLSAEVRAKKMEDIQEKRSGLEFKSKQIERTYGKLVEEGKRVQERLMATYQTEMKTLETKIRAIIEELSVEHAWDIVITKESTIFTSAKVDVTATVIAKLDAMHAQETTKNKIETTEKVKPADKVVTQTMSNVTKK